MVDQDTADMFDAALALTPASLTAEVAAERAVVEAAAVARERARPAHESTRPQIPTAAEIDVHVAKRAVAFALLWDRVDALAALRAGRGTEA